MWSYKNFSVDQKVIFWTGLLTLSLSVPVFWMGAALTGFSLLLGLLPWNILARIFGGEVAQTLLILQPLLSYGIALGLVLGVYWILIKGIKIIYGAGSVDLPSEKLNKIKIACAFTVNLLYFLFLYVFFPAKDWP